MYFRTLFFVASVPIFISPLACSDGGQQSLNTGGSLSSGGSDQAPGSGGLLGSGGSSSGLASGGAGTGEASEEVGTGGHAANAGGRGGSDVGDAGGSGGSSIGSGGTYAGEMHLSLGCGKSGRPEGGKVYVAGESWLLFPNSYDGSKPLPVLFGFHGCGGGDTGNRGSSSRTEYSDLIKGSAFENEYVVAIPLSSDTEGCWNYSADMVRVKKLYDELVNNYCVDLDHIFATGHSSGAQFIIQTMMGSHAADADYLGFKAVAPDAASDYGALNGPMPVMYIQGKKDNVRNSDGHETVAQLVKANMCQSTSTPYTDVMGCQSSGKEVNPGCISYDGCTVPTVWCAHDDPAYSGTSHGVPCFGMTAIETFFKSLD